MKSEKAFQFALPRGKTDAWLMYMSLAVSWLESFNVMKYIQTSYSLGREAVKPAKQKAAPEIELKTYTFCVLTHQRLE